MNKIAIVGCGAVGMSYAFALIAGGANVDELVLIDKNKEKAEGEAMDLNHAVPYSKKNVKVYAGDYSDCNGSSIVALCAGANQEVNETRADLVFKNYKIFASIIGEINKTDFKGIYLVATNPLDVMTYFTKELSGFDSNRVIGTGTTLDSARLRYLIGKELDISPKNIHAYVVGEHGDSEFVPWSTAKIGLSDIDEFLSENQKAYIAYDVKTSAYDIINKKGNTSYGIGMSMLKITNAILFNSNAIMSVCAYNKQHDIYFSMPSVIGKNGINKTLWISLNRNEENCLIASIEAITKTKNMIENKK